MLFASRGKIIRPLFPFSSNCKQGIIALGLRLYIQPRSENRAFFGVAVVDHMETSDKSQALPRKAPVSKVQSTAVCLFLIPQVNANAKSKF